MSDHTEAVVAAARKLGFLDAKGAITDLDSLQIIDLVLELERALKIRVPPSKLERRAFRSVDEIVAFLRSIAGPA
jgi:acyl carrier protein